METNNMNIRARFEEIWPVPAGLKWDRDAGSYRVRMYYGAWSSICDSYNARLDTFTRCQETTSIHLSLIDELVKSLQWYVDEDEIHEHDPDNKYWVDGKHEAEALLDRAKQIMGDKK